VGRCGVDIPIGVIDTGVDLSHPTLTGAQVAVRTIRSPDRPPSDPDHGTAVVSLLVGRADSEVAGIFPEHASSSPTPFTDAAKAAAPRMPTT
jgi:subtilisin family serine protease